MKLKRFFTICTLLFSTTQLFSQRAHLQIGTQIPLNYSVGFEYQIISNRLAGNMQVGILTSPYDAAILEILKAFGTDEALTNTIGNAFSTGIIAQPSVKYCWKKNYIGLNYSYYGLKALEAPVEAIETYYDTDIPERNTNKKEFTLKSNLSNAGLFYGRKFTFKEYPKLGLNLELALQKTFSSNSKLEGFSRREPERLNTLISDELNTVYLAYGYLPSVNIFFVYTIGK